MLFVLFHVGDDQFALECRQVIEIIPMVTLKRLPHAPGYIAGLFRYRGVVVPVIDLCSLIRGTPCKSLLSTRIILVEYPGQDNSRHTLGLMAERIMETMAAEKNELAQPGIDLDEAPYLGKMICRGHEMTQCISIEQLLPESLRFSLFKAGDVHDE